MMKFLIIYQVVILQFSLGSVINNRCFDGGELIHTIVANHSLPYICVKDDIGYLKTDVIAMTEPSDLKTVFKNDILRKYSIPDWKRCRPEKTIGGPIMILSVDDDGHINSEDYICKNECDIKVNKEDGVIIMETKEYNYYQITGTTISTGWFRTITTISLKHTCENLKIQCGETSILLHACFKSHMECFQMLNKGILPKHLVASFCTNLELIILLTFITLVFLLFSLISKTYLSYILLPIFIPASYIISKLKAKFCKLCTECALVIHPFSKCSLTCVCGNTFDSTNRLKLHRTGGLCPGYKNMMIARKMCKSKGCGLIFSILVSLILFSFLKPVGAIETNNNIDIDCYTLQELPAYIRNSTNQLEKIQQISRVSMIAEISGLFTIVIILILIMSKPHLFLRRYIMKCEDCQMFHSKVKLRYDEFGTNKCGSCTCGCPDEPPMNKYHQTSILCTSKYHIRLYKIVSLLLVFFSITQIVTLGVVAEECSDNYIETDCWGTEIEKIMQKAMTAFAQDPRKALTDLFPTITEKEITHLFTLPDEYWQLLALEKKYDSMKALQALEAYYHRDPKHNFMNEVIGSDLFIPKVSGIKMCTQIGKSSPCECILEGKHCEIFNNYLMRKSTHVTSITKTDTLQSDLNKLIDIALKVIQPTTLVVYREITKTSNATIFSNFASKVYKMYHENPYINNFMFLMLNITEKIGLNNVVFPNLLETLGVSKIVSNLGTANPSFQADNLEIGNPRMTCSNPRRWICNSPRIINDIIDGLLTCDPIPGGKYTLHKWTDDLVMQKSEACRYDKLCMHSFENATEADKSIILQVRNCKSIGQLYNNDLNEDVSHCNIIQKGTCIVGTSNKQIVQCKEGFYAEQRFTGYYDGSHRIDKVCLSAGCIKVNKINAINLKNCTISVARQVTKKLANRYTDSIDNYKLHLEEEFLSSLKQTKFIPTSGLPHILPSFNPVSIQGVETVNGLESAYILFDIIALSGKSTGLKLTTKDGEHLFDIVAYIKSCNVSSGYEFSYRTGRTISYNSIHDEHCTGRCPEIIPRKDRTWSTFSREDTSRWGCEEFGCLAIGEGCLFGQCKDIIKPEAQVYEKASEEKISAEICITTNDVFYCHSVTAGLPIIENKIEVQLFTVESFKLPNRVLIRDNKIYTGQINRLGEYNKYCGNVQMVNSTVLGTGIPLFDYHCHAASRKDIIIRKCYDNNYDSCTSLPESKDVIIDEENGDIKKIAMHEKNIGSIRVKLMLGDISYKIFQKEPQLDISANCAGCTNCLEGISCHIKIKTESETSCEISSDCNSFLNRLHIKTAVKDYYMKFQCPNLQDSLLVFTICKSKVEVNVKLVSQKPILEIGTIHDAPFLKEHDDRCPTWMCRVAEEGLGFIFSPITGFFSKIWHIILIIGIVLLCAFIMIYIIVPMCMKLTGTLKKHELEYIAESKMK
ncbi:polyprotein [Boraceia virus]|nr:polyprotein [Boraceia virus]